MVKSWRAGVGKTLHKKRLTEKLHSLHAGVARTKKAVVSIPLHEREINIDDIMNVLLQNTLHPGKIEPRLFHIDLSHEVIVSGPPQLISVLNLPSVDYSIDAQSNVAICLRTKEINFKISHG